MSSASDDNPYQPPALPSEADSTNVPGLWWKTLWHKFLIVLKGGAYGVIAFECIILFGTIGIRIISGQNVFHTNSPATGILLAVATVAAVLTAPLYIWLMLQRSGTQ